MSSITLLVGALLGMASWLAPNHYSPWLSFHAEFLMGAAGLLVLIGELSSSPRQREPISTLTVATLLMICVPVVQASVGLISFAGDAWMTALYLLAFALSQVLGQMLCRRRGVDEMCEGLSAVFAVASIACVGLQLIQWLRLPGLGIFSIEVPPGHSPYANVAQPNHLASMLFLGVVGQLFLYERGRVRGLAAAMTYLLLAFGLVMTGSRTAWLTMGLATVVLSLAAGRGLFRISRAQVLGCGTAFFLMLLAWAPLNDLLLLSQGRTFAVQAQLGPRPLLWATMLAALSLQPWFGYGWGQGLVAQGTVIERFPADGRLMENSHNLLMDLAVWNGLPLALALSALLAWWFWRQFRVSRSAAQLCMLTGVCGVFVHAMLEFPLSYLYFLIPVGILMGALDAAVPVRAAVRWPNFAPWGLTLVAGLMMVGTVREYAEIEPNVRTLQLEIARVGTHKIVSEAPTLVLLTQWGAYLRLARIEPHTGMSTDELAWMEKVVQRFPYASAQLIVAASEGLNGRSEAAAGTLNRLCLLHTRANCMAQLLEWRELVSAHPQLSAVPLPRLRPVSHQ